LTSPLPNVRVSCTVAAFGAALLVACPYPTATTCTGDEDCPSGSVCDRELRVCSSDPESSATSQADAATDAMVVEVDASGVDARGQDLVVADGNLSDGGAPDSAVPDQAGGDMAGADAAALDIATPDAASADLVSADIVALDVAATDSSVTDAGALDSAVSDSAATDSAAVDSAMPDAATPDSATPDSAMPDAAMPDSATPDTAAPDAAAPDTSEPDSACTTPALSFDGVDDFAEFPDSASLDGMATLTLEAWILPGAGDVVAGTEAFIISHHDPAGDDGYALLLRDGWLELRVHDDAEGHVDPHSVWAAYDEGKRLLAGYWYHVAGSFDGANLYIFVDGVLQRSESEPNPVISDAAAPLRIGAAALGGGVFSGLIDEVRVSNSCRYTADFTPLVAPFVTDGQTVALWHLGEGSGQLLADDSANSNNGTLGPSVDENAEDPAWQSVLCIPDRPLGSTVDAGLPDASELPTCFDIYGAAPGYVLCEETLSTCEFNANTGGGNCDTMCQSYGGACLEAFDNIDPVCERRGYWGDDCSSNRGNEICVCTRQ